MKNLHQIIVRCVCLMMSTLLLIDHAQGLYCVQCESTRDALCGIGLVRPTKCENKGAVACMTMVGKIPGEISYTQRTCTSKVRGSFCTQLEPIPGLTHEMCVKSCMESGCNARPIADIDFNRLTE